jgi:hypothetical protein
MTWLNQLADGISNNLQGLVDKGQMHMGDLPFNQVQGNTVVTQVLDAIRERRAKRCPHVSPRQPICVRMHAPDELDCWQCAERKMAATDGTPEDLTCDFCRRLLPELILPIMFQMGTMIFMGGACDQCWDRGSTVDGTTQVRPEMS